MLYPRGLNDFEDTDPLMPALGGVASGGNLITGHEYIQLNPACYCKTLYICGIKFLRCNENDIWAYMNFDGHDIP